jgi:hypothetical protein
MGSGDGGGMGGRELDLLFCENLSNIVRNGWAQYVPI